MTVEWLVKYTAMYVALSLMLAWLKKKADGKSANSFLYGAARSAWIAAVGVYVSFVSWQNSPKDARWILVFIVGVAVVCWFGMDAAVDVGVYSALRKDGPAKDKAEP